MVNDTSESYHKLCDSLNIDRESIDEAWSNYQSIKQNYTLEVSNMIIFLIETIFDHFNFLWDYPRFH